MVKSNGEESMTDQEFLDAIKARIHTAGVQTGSIGLLEGPNCLLGHAGYVVHGDTLKTEHNAGVTPIEVDGHPIVADEIYELVPGMVRFAHLLGFRRTFDVALLNDRIGADPERLVEAIDERTANVFA